MVLNKSKRVIALGFFDGVHRGHGALLKRVVEKSRELGAVASAFTFDRSPTAAITGQVVPRWRTGRGSCAPATASRKSLSPALTA